MGFDTDGIIGVVMALSTNDFYKNMTSHADHRIWQDAYRPSALARDVYLKITVVDDVVVVSFLEL